MKELDWKPSIIFEEAFAETITWYLENPEWIARVREKTGVLNPHIDLWGKVSSNSTKVSFSPLVWMKKKIK